VLEQTVLQLPDLLDTMDSVDSAHRPFVSTSLRRYALFFKRFLLIPWEIMWIGAFCVVSMIVGDP
jgi:hypothetical protein